MNVAAEKGTRAVTAIVAVGPINGGVGRLLRRRRRPGQHKR